MEKIKNFIYLDDLKMYSFSSQLFEGMVDYILKGNSDTHIESDQQKGNFFTGKVMADALSVSNNQLQKVLLHDYAYNLFEKEVIKSKKVYQLGATASNIYENLQDCDFVKVTGNIILNDANSIEKTINTFNEFGLSLTKIVQGKEILEKISHQKSNFSDLKDKNQQSRNSMEIAKLNRDLKNLASQMGLQMDEQYIESLAYVLKYGYNGQFEVQLPVINATENCFFSSVLNRDKIRESEELINKKYSRLTEREFTIFGIVTQTRESNLDAINDKLIASTENSNMKQAILNIISKLNGLEKMFTGRISNEYIIDPIAIYQEL